MNLRLVLFFLIAGGLSEAFKILVLYPTPAVSHQRPIMALTERLVRDGHELFVVSPNVVPILANHSNYTFVDVSFSYQYYAHSTEKKDDVADLQRKLSKYEVLSFFVPYADIPRKQFLSEEFLNFKKRVESENLRFDAVIAQTFSLPYAAPMSRILTKNAPIITMSSFVIDHFAEDLLGSVMHLSFVPSIFGHYTDRMSLWQKLENWVSHRYLMSRITEIMEAGARRYFTEAYGPQGGDLVDGCWESISLALITSNAMYFYLRRLGPNVVEVGPLHLTRPEVLLQNLQEWLDGAGRGVIYFSLGSNFRSASLPKDVINNLLKVFEALPNGYRVLWKFEVDSEDLGQHDNVLIQKWMPQQSVLAHPKVRVFMTQGGLQSFQEAVHYGVPLVGIPWFGDHECQVSKMMDAKIGERLAPEDLYSVEKIKEALERVLYDDRYLKNMRKLSSISQDFTSQALDKAVFWVEHVARHGGASHLRPSTADATLSEYFCLDLISTILVLTSTICFSIHFVYRLIVIVYRKPHLKLKDS
nr:PREDICTED: UDP-glucuronosyltransferase 2B7-like [Bemisia tabaci]XP_018896854.1 PREDICTED: UDP-glucuronosyltransferase 2B7-like [Bemisia tabaci]